MQIQIVIKSQVIDLEEGAEGKKSVIGGGEDTVSHFFVKKKAPILFCVFEKYGVQFQIWMFSGSVQDLSDGLEEPEGSAGKIRVDPA